MFYPFMYAKITLEERHREADRWRLTASARLQSAGLQRRGITLLAEVGRLLSSLGGSLESRYGQSARLPSTPLREEPG